MDGRAILLVELHECYHRIEVAMGRGVEVVANAYLLKITNFYIHTTIYILTYIH